MPRRGDEIGYLNPETMEWVTTGKVGDPDAKDASLFGPDPLRAAYERIGGLEQENQRIREEAKVLYGAVRMCESFFGAVAEGKEDDATLRSRAEMAVEAIGRVKQREGK